jgi:hypothetical protein
LRTLSATLTANQAGVGVTGLPYNPIWKIVLTRSGQATKTYTKTRVISISHIEEEFNQTATVLLDNTDNALTALDFEMYKGVISYGYNDPTAGDEYSACAPLYVTRQRNYSAQGVSVCHLRLVGIPNLMAKDKAESELELDDGDNRTVKGLITAIAQKTLAPYTNYTSYTATFDSEDTLIDSFKPKSSFRVGINNSRMSKIRELLGWTGCKMRAEDDGEIHIFDPTTTGASYDYEYKLAVSGSHTFFNKELINRFVDPNKEVIESHPAHTTQYSASTTSATSYALDPKTHTTYLRLASTAQALSIGTAKIETYELDADRGAGIVPMNVGQEVFDYVKITDSRQSDSKVGNVRYIKRDVRVPSRGGRLIFDMEIRFGKLNLEPINIFPSGVGTEKGISTEALANAYRDLYESIWGEEGEGGEGTLVGKLNELINAFNERGDIAIFRKLTVLEEQIIPGEE